MYGVPDAHQSLAKGNIPGPMLARASTKDIDEGDGLHRNQRRIALSCIHLRACPCQQMFCFSTVRLRLFALQRNNPTMGMGIRRAGACQEVGLMRCSDAEHGRAEGIDHEIRPCGLAHREQDLGPGYGVDAGYRKQ
jgi:hypothetical protein